jgi:hypothetical protein
VEVGVTRSGINWLVNPDGTQGYSWNPTNAIGGGYDISFRREGMNVWEVARLPLLDRAGSDMAEWPADLRVRQRPVGW